LADQDAPPRSLVEALRQEPIDGARIQEAYLRFLRERTAVPVWWRGPRVARWAAFAVVAGVSSVYAATLIRPFAASPPPAEVSSTAPASAPVPPAHKLRTPPRGEAPAEAEVAPEPQATPESDAGPTNAAPEPPSRGPAATPSADPWKRAARGLRDGDFQSANAALKELTRKGTEADRESALLVQAQVLLAQGRDAEARTLLKSLEASARAPSVRRKSTELLGRLREKPAQRSGKSRAGTELP
jgi:hypothetical protein